MHPELDYASAYREQLASLTEDPAVLIEDGVETSAGEGRLLQGVEINGKSCDNPEAFQIKAGKMLIAYLIITCLKCS